MSEEIKPVESNCFFFNSRAFNSQPSTRLQFPDFPGLTAPSSHSFLPFSPVMPSSQTTTSMGTWCCPILPHSPDSEPPPASTSCGLSHIPSVPSSPTCCCALGGLRVHLTSKSLEGYKQLSIQLLQVCVHPYDCLLQHGLPESSVLSPVSGRFSESLRIFTFPPTPHHSSHTDP